MTMNKTQYLLCKIVEEASEIAHTATKAQQFGLDEVHPGRLANNACALCSGMDRLIAMMAMLNEESGLNYTPDNGISQIKRLETLYHARRSVELGYLSEPFTNE